MSDKLHLPFTIYEGEDIFKIDEDNAEPIIDGIIYKEDFVQLIAEDKMGKTILSLQMAASLSSGTPFLGVFDIPKPVKVWYFSHEGKHNVMKDRLMRINKIVPVDLANIKLMCGSKFQWNEEGNLEVLEHLLDRYKDELPEVIIIDPLYAASKGDLNAVAPMKEFIHIVRSFAEACKSSVFLVHHMKKNQRDEKGNHYTRNDGDGYGSAVFKWAVDHVFFLDKFKYESGETYNKKNPDRVLQCNTQRSGDIASGVRIRLTEPDPLGFHIVEKHLEGQHKILSLLKANPKGLTADQLMKLSKIKRTSFFTVKKELENSDQICSEGNRPKVFKIKEMV